MEWWKIILSCVLFCVGIAMMLLNRESNIYFISGSVLIFLAAGLHSYWDNKFKKQIKEL